MARKREPDQPTDFADHGTGDVWHPPATPSLTTPPHDDFVKPPPEPVGGPDWKDEELSLLREENARLKTNLKDLETKNEEQLSSLTPVQSVSDYWRVCLQDQPDHVVAAPNEHLAWPVYCAEMGVISSIHRHTVGPATREEYRLAQAKRFKVKPEEFKLPGD